MPVAARVYAEQLLSRGHGLPLWEPEPSELGEVEIGDVGFIDEGSFCRLFNATRHKDDPVNVFGVPDSFAILEYNERALRHTSADYVLPGPIYSSSMRHFSVGGGPSIQGIGGSYKFNCHSNQGALVVLGDHGTRSIVRKNTVFEQYMRTHRDSWLEFARSLGYNVDSDDIILVSGWTKTSQWALAACTNYGRAHEVTLDASVGAIAGAKFEIKLCQDVEMSVDQRSGPSRLDKIADGPLPRDQCLFLRYYKTKRNTFGVKKIVAGSGPRRWSSYDETERRTHTGVPADEHRTHGTPRQGSYDSASGTSNWLQGDVSDDFSDIDEISEEPCTLQQTDPLDVLLDYILNHSTAELAIVCYEDLYNICSGEWPVNLDIFLQNVAPHIEVDEHSLGTFRHHGDASRALPCISEGNLVEHNHELNTSHSPEEPEDGTLMHTSPTTQINDEVPISMLSNSNTLVCAPEDGDSGSETTAEEDGKISDLGRREAFEGVPTVAEETSTEDARSLFDVHGLLYQYRQAYDRQLQRPRAHSRTAHPRSPWCIDPYPFQHYICQLNPAHPQSQDMALGPDKYSTKVLSTAPLGYIFLYRACTRFTARPHLAAAHILAGIAVGTMVYRKRRSATLGYGHLQVKSIATL